MCSEEPPEVGTSGHLNWSEMSCKDINKKLDAWLEGRGLARKSSSPYRLLGEFGPKKKGKRKKK